MFVQFVMTSLNFKSSVLIILEKLTELYKHHTSSVCVEYSHLKRAAT